MSFSETPIICFDFAGTLTHTSLPAEEELFNLIRTSSASYTVMIISRSGTKAITSFLDEHNLTDAIDGITTVLSSDEKTEALIELARTANVYAFISDTVSDMTAGTHAQIPTIGVTWGFADARQLGEASPTAIVETVRELAEVLDDLPPAEHVKT